MDAAALLKETPLFAELNESDLADLGPSTRLESFRPGQTIVREGHAGAAFYVIIAGKVEVIKGVAGGGVEVVGTLGRGEFFGEAAVMKHTARSASVRAVEATECLVIRRLDLDSIIERYPVLAARIEVAHAARFD